MSRKNFYYFAVEDGNHA